jgi:xylan 1,4-beta-xylosidase
MLSSRFLPFSSGLRIAASLILAAAGMGAACGGGGAKGGLGGAGGGGNAPGAQCADTALWTSDGAATVALAVDASATGAPWSRFYEGAVATDHANTILSSAYGRNAAAALQKGHDQAGFRYARFHGILNNDIGVYPAAAPALATDTPAYNWTRFDMVYDAVMAAGMRPIVEISFTPPGLASTGTVQTQLWYNNVSPNISKPIRPPTGDAGALPTWGHWQKFMSDIVTHLESRYGADEVRNNWYFEVWNEASWMYEPGAGGYNELYLNTAKGLLAGDPMVRIGGPADSAGNSQYSIPSLIDYAKAQGVKLDFISFHQYGKDHGPDADVGSFMDTKNTFAGIVDNKGFTGDFINDEFGSTYEAALSRDTEVSASFVAKAIHFLATDTTTRAPAMYGYWALSDIYEEINTGAPKAYREGNYGLLLKGDDTIPVSYDLAKPAFNAFRLLHMMTDTTVPVTGGVGDAHTDGVGSVATLAADGKSLQILVYNHVNNFDTTTWEAMTQETTLVSLAVDHLPFTPTRVLHYVVDHTHSNSHTVWAAMGKPLTPTADQWQTLSDASELCYYAATWNGGNSMTVKFPQSTYSASLIELRRD